MREEINAWIWWFVVLINMASVAFNSFVVYHGYWGNAAWVIIGCIVIATYVILFRPTRKSKE